MFGSANWHRVIMAAGRLAGAADERPESGFQQPYNRGTSPEGGLTRSAASWSLRSHVSRKRISSRSISARRPWRSFRSCRGRGPWRAGRGAIERPPHRAHRPTTDTGRTCRAPHRRGDEPSAESSAPGRRPLPPLMVTARTSAHDLAREDGGTRRLWLRSPASRWRMLPGPKPACCYSGVWM